MRIHPPAVLIGTVVLTGLGLLGHQMAQSTRRPRGAQEGRDIAQAMKELEAEVAASREDLAKTSSAQMAQAEADLAQAEQAGDDAAAASAQKRLDALREMDTLKLKLFHDRHRLCAGRLGPRSAFTEEAVWRACLSGDTDE